MSAWPLPKGESITRKKLATETNGPSGDSFSEMPGFSPDHSTVPGKLIVSAMRPSCVFRPLYPSWRPIQTRFRGAVVPPQSDPTCARDLFAHDLVRKPETTFRGHARGSKLL